MDAASLVKGRACEPDRALRVAAAGLGFCWWQIRSVRRLQRAREAREAAERAAAAKPPGG